MVINTIFVSHFVDPDLSFAMSSKEGNIKRRGVGGGGGGGVVAEIEN